MIFNSTEKLRKFLLRQKKRRSLRTIQRETFPEAKVGTLSRIINDTKYDPANKDVRNALRLATDICHACKRKILSHQSATTRQPAPKIGERGWLVENLNRRIDLVWNSPKYDEEYLRGLGVIK